MVERCAMVIRCRRRRSLLNIAHAVRKCRQRGSQKDDQDDSEDCAHWPLQRGQLNEREKRCEGSASNDWWLNHPLRPCGFPNTSRNRHGLTECTWPPHSAHRNRADSCAMVRPIGTRCDALIGLSPRHYSPHPFHQDLSKHEALYPIQE
jgi:hypothetical protein